MSGRDAFLSHWTALPVGELLYLKGGGGKLDVSEKTILCTTGGG